MFCKNGLKKTCVFDRAKAQTAPRQDGWLARPKPGTESSAPARRGRLVFAEERALAFRAEKNNAPAVRALPVRPPAQLRSRCAIEIVVHRQEAPAAAGVGKFMHPRARAWQRKRRGGRCRCGRKRKPKKLSHLFRRPPRFGALARGDAQWAERKGKGSDGGRRGFRFRKHANFFSSLSAHPATGGSVSSVAAALARLNARGVVVGSGGEARPDSDSRRGIGALIFFFFFWRVKTPSVRQSACPAAPVFLVCCAALARACVNPSSPTTNDNSPP